MKMQDEHVLLYKCKQYAAATQVPAARACSARNFPTFLGRLWLQFRENS